VGAGILGNELSGGELLRWAGSLQRGLWSSEDSFANLQALFQNGDSGILRAYEAMAAAGDGTSEWSIVTIKIANHVHTPLVFKLGAKDAQGNVTSQAPTVKAGSGKAGAHLETAGVDRISDKARFANLRMNKWFADILANGEVDWRPAGSTEPNRLGVPSAFLGAFPANVAVQCALHLEQTDTTLNHSMKGYKVRKDQGDLCKIVKDKKLVVSPLEMTCFMMGKNYDHAEGSSSINIVCSGADEAFAVSGKPVKDFYDLMSQSLKDGYGDASPIERNLTYSIDRLVTQNPRLRSKIIDTRAVFAERISGLQKASEIESAIPQTYDVVLGNGQANNAASAAGTEFLGQCLYVANALGIEGQPLRNFSLFLNINDLDGQPLDNLILNLAGVKEGTEIRSVTYIEGMRQLALGLNMLSQVIATGKKVIVQVISEGGRGPTFGDNKVGFSLVLGPMGAGLLKDFLYCNTEAINSETSNVVKAPGAIGSGNVAWNVPGLMDEKGLPLTGVVTNVGDFQAGVAEFLGSQTGIANATEGLGRYVKLARG
jgi:hypothetical protein